MNVIERGENCLALQTPLAYLNYNYDCQWYHGTMETIKKSNCYIDVFSESFYRITFAEVATAGRELLIERQC